MQDNLRQKRRARIRAKMQGTAQRPRASVFRSNTQMTVQLVDDTQQRTLAAASGKPEEVGTAIGEAAKKLGVSAVIFDRGGYLYHGRVKAVADSMRKAGLEF